MEIYLDDILAGDVVVARKIQKAALEAGLSVEEFVGRVFSSVGGATPPSETWPAFH